MSIKSIVGGALGFAVGGPAGAAIGAGIGGASESADVQSEAAKQAAQTSSSASQYATDVQKQMFEAQRADLEPWRKAGVNALAQMTAGTMPGGEYMRPFSAADFQADPGYQFRLSEGLKALERSAAARGGLLSGSTLKGISRYGQDLASQEYQNAFNRYQTNQAMPFNRLAALAGIGQTATGALGTAGSQYAGNIGNIAMSNAANIGTGQLMAGQARASAYQGIGNIIGRTNWGSVFGGGNQPPAPVEERSFY